MNSKSSGDPLQEATYVDPSAHESRLPILDPPKENPKSEEMPTVPQKRGPGEQIEKVSLPFLLRRISNLLSAACKIEQEEPTKGGEEGR